MPSSHKITTFFTPLPPVFAALVPLPTVPSELGDFVRQFYEHKILPLPTKIPSTRKWTHKELAFFHLHHFQVRNEWFETLMVPHPGPDFKLSAEAMLIFDTHYGPKEFLDGLHTQHNNYVLTEFGDLIVEIMSFDFVEAATDKLANLLMRVCNRHTLAFTVTGQAQKVKVKVGMSTFSSIPDLTAILRKNKLAHISTAFIVVEDKTITGGNTECQIPGEMLAVACRNHFDAKIPGDQTIFAMRVIGTAVAFFRAEFSEAYLQSVAAGAPTTPVTIFRFGGSFAGVVYNPGLDVSSDTFQRKLVFDILTSIFDYCHTYIYPYWNVKQAAPKATEKLAMLNQE